MSLADEFARTALSDLPVFRIARRLSVDADVAAELVHETYLQAWKSFDPFADPGTCRGWLYRILLTVCHSRARQQAPLSRSCSPPYPPLWAGDYRIDGRSPTRWRQ